MRRPPRRHQNVRRLCTQHPFFNVNFKSRKKKKHNLLFTFSSVSSKPSGLRQPTVMSALFFKICRMIADLLLAAASGGMGADLLLAVACCRMLVDLLLATACFRMGADRQLAAACCSIVRPVTLSLVLMCSSGMWSRNLTISGTFLALMAISTGERVPGAALVGSAPTQNV